MRFQDPNTRTPYQVQWNFTIDRALPGKWTVSASYTGNHGRTEDFVLRPKGGPLITGSRIA